MFSLRNVFRSRTLGRRTPGRRRKGLRHALPLRMVAPSEALEDRTLLAANVLATVDSSVNAPYERTELTFNLISSSSKTVAFLAHGTGGGLNPTSIHVETASGTWIGSGSAIENYNGAGSSLRLVNLSPGEYRLKITGEGGTTGNFRVETRFIGDLNSDNHVTDAELQEAVLAANQALFGFGSGSYRVEFDALLDGTVDNFDVGVVNGNIGSAWATLVGDQQPPAIQVDLLNDNGPSNSDNVTNDPTIVGRVTDASDVTAFRGRFDGNGSFTSLLGQLDGAGNFTLTEQELIDLGGLSQLEDGQHTLELTATDAQGNSTPTPVTFTFTLDREAPAPPELLDLDAASDTGVSDTDDVTADDTPTLNSDVPDDHTIRVFSSIDGFVGSSLANGSVSLTTSQLSEGTHQFTATSVDLAGNESAASTVLLTVDVDVTAPAVPEFNLQGAEDEVPTTPTTPVTLEGSTEPGVEVELFADGGPALQTTTADGTTGDFTFAGVDLAFGENTLRTLATDVAGNSSEFTRTVIRNDAPVVANPPANVNVDEDADDVLVDLANVFDDANLVEGDSLTFTVENNTDASLVATSLAGDDLTLDFLDDQNGAATITLRATDTFGAFAETTLVVNVAAVNDAPVVVSPIANVVVDEDAADTVIDLGPVFADVDVATNADSLVHTFADDSTEIDNDLFTATISGSTLTIDYKDDANGGPVTLTVKATDIGGLSATDAFDVTVNPVNDAPVADDGSATTAEDTPVDVDVSGLVSDVENDDLTISVVASTNGTAVVTDPNNTPADPNDDVITFTPAQDFNGQATVTYKVDDGDLESNEATITIDVTAVNDAPVNLLDGDPLTDSDVVAVAENLTLDFNGRLSIADVDAGTGELTTTVSVAEGTLAADGDTDSDPATVTLTGTVAEINADLATLVFTPRDYDPSELPDDVAITMVTNDGGHTGADPGGSDPNSEQAAHTFTIRVVDDEPPEVANPIGDVTVDEDAANRVIDLAGVFSDPEDDDATLQLSVAGNTNAGLVTTDLVGTQLTLDFLANQNGTADVTVQARDSAGNVTTDTFTVTVNPVNDAPTIASPIADVTVDEDAADTVIDLGPVFADVDIATNGDELTYTFDDGSTQVDNAVFTATIDNAARTLTIDYKDDANGGPITLGVRATDGELNVTDTFDVTVGAVNDAPTILAPASHVIDEDNSLNFGDAVGTTAQFFYSIDIETDELVLVNAATGGVSVVGSTGHDFFRADMAYVDGTLYAVTADGPSPFNGPNWSLIGLDPVTGAKVSETEIEILGSQPTIVDGLTARDGTLYVAFDRIDTTPSYLGTIDPATGVITSIVDYEAVDGFDHDFDGLGVNAEGTFFVVDSQLASGDNRQVVFNQLGEGPFTVTQTGLYNDLFSAASDLAHDGSNLYLLDGGRNEIVRLDSTAPDDPLSRTLLGTAGASLDGLAAAPRIVFSDLDANESGGDGILSATFTATLGTLTVTPGSGANVSGDGTGDLNILGTLTQINAAVEGLTYTPDDNVHGEDTLSITINDRGNVGADPGDTGDANSEEATQTVTITINPVNDAPENTVPGAQVVDEDQNLGFTGDDAITVADVDLDEGTNTLRTTLTVSNGILTVAAGSGADITADGTTTVVIEGTPAEVNAALAGLVYTPNANYNGPDTLTVTTNDLGNFGSGGAQEDVSTVAITVNPVDDAPVNDVPGPQTTDEDTDLVFTGADAISVSDVDAGTDDVTVTLEVGNGTLALGGTTNVAVTGDGTATVEVTGAIADVNTALGGLVYSPNENFNGDDTLTVTTDDLGHNGSGGPLTDVDTVAITVNAVNDAPVNLLDGVSIQPSDVLNVAENSTLDFDGSLSIADVDAGTGDLTTTVSVEEGTLAATGDTDADPATVTLTGTVAEINASLATLVFTPRDYDPSELPDDVSITIVTNDGGHTGADPGGSDPNSEQDSDTFTIRVDDDQPPTVENPIADVTVDEDAADEVIDLTGVFADAEDDDATLTLTVDSNTNPSLVDASLTGFTLTLDFLENQNGTAQITVQAEDSAGNTTTDTFTVDVNPVNDAPTVADPIADVTVDEDAPNTVIDLGPVFDDVDIATDGDSLSYTFADGTSVVDNALFEATISGSTLTIDYEDDANGGPVTLTVRATDGELDVTDAFDVTVNPVNDAPVAEDGTAVTDEDTPVDVDVAPFVSDVDGDDLTITVVGATNGNAVVTDPNNTPADPTDDVITFTPAENFFGEATVTYKVDDGTVESNEATITVTVNAVNDTPTVVNPIGDVTVNEDAPDTVIDLGPVFDDVEDASLTHTFADGTTTVDNAIFEATISGSTLTIDYKADANGGPIALAVKATDSGTLDVTDFFDVTVNAVNDAPTVDSPIADVTVDEDAPDTVVNLDDVFADVDVATNGDLLTYTFAGGGTTLDNDLFNATISGAELRIDYKANANGSVDGVTVRATDTATAFVEDSFDVTVNAVNDAPVVVSPLPDVNAGADDPNREIDLGPVFDDPDLNDTPPDTLTYTVTVTNETAANVVDATIQNGDTLVLDFGGDLGTADVTVRATDGSGVFVEDVFQVSTETPKTLEFELVVRQSPTSDGEFTFFRQQAGNGEGGMGHFQLVADQNELRYSFRLLQTSDTTFDFGHLGDTDPTNDVTNFAFFDESGGSPVQIFDVLADATFDPATESISGVWEAGEQGTSIATFVDELRAGELSTRIELNDNDVRKIAGQNIRVAEELTELPQSIDEVFAGESYVVEIYLRDLALPDPGEQGVSAAIAEIGFQPSLISDATEIAAGSIYDFGIRDVSIGSDTIRVGGFTLLPSVAENPHYARLGTFEFTASAPGTHSLTTGPADSANTRGGTEVPVEDIRFGTASVDQIAPTTFTIVNSTITIDGTVDGDDVSPQAPGTDVNSFTSSSTVDVVFDDADNPSTIRLVGSDLDVATNATEVAPDPADLGVVGTAPGDYGFSLTIPDVLGEFDGDLRIALRNLLVDVTSSGALTLVDNGTGGHTFDAGQLAYELEDGQESHHTVVLDSTVVGQNATNDLGGLTLTDNGAADPILTRSGNTLTLEFFVNHTLSFTIDGSPVSFTAVGSYTAEATLPAPLTGTETATGDAAVATSVVLTTTPTIDGHVATVPTSESWISEWDEHWVEVWVRAGEEGVRAADVTLDYDGSAFTATDVDFAPAFEDYRVGTVDDTAGTVQLSAQTPQQLVGLDGWALLARVKMESLEGDGVDIAGDDLLAAEPSSLGTGVVEASLVLTDGATATADVAPANRTELRPVVWDVDDNGRIDFADASHLVAAFGDSVHVSTSPYAWWLDGDRSGRIDFADFGTMVGNFGLSKDGGQRVSFPAEFDRGWYGSDIAGVGDDAVDEVLEAALETWQTRLDTGSMPQVQLVVRDLGGARLGQAEILGLDENGVPNAGRITIDDDAAGLGWYADADMFDFTAGLVQGASEVTDHYDLFTVLLHELGHVLGFTENYGPFGQHVERDGDTVVFKGPDFEATLTADGLHLDEAVHAGDVMNETLDPGVRKLPSELDAAILKAAYAVADANSTLPTSPAPLTAAPAKDAATPTAFEAASSDEAESDAIGFSVEESPVLPPVVNAAPTTGFEAANRTPRRRDDGSLPVTVDEDEQDAAIHDDVETEAVDSAYEVSENESANADAVFANWNGPIL